MFDTHVHLDGLQAEGDLEGCLARAEEAGVHRILAVGGRPEGNRLALEQAAQRPGRIAAAIGYDHDMAKAIEHDPNAVASLVAQLETAVRDAAGRGTDIAALGEIGLDFHYAPESADAQQALIREQLRLARALDVPVVLHSREAEAATLALLREHVRACKPGHERLGVLHCFTSGPAFAEQLLELGLHISFSGIVSFKNAATVREAARIVPETRLLMETDSPYLAPVPHRGKPNEPAYVRFVAEALAAVRGVTPAAIEAITTRNAEQLFDVGRGE